LIEEKKKVCIFEMKENRLAALSEQERKGGHFTRIDQMGIPDETPVRI
jgi:hypothetical protein